MNRFNKLKDKQSDDFDIFIYKGIFTGYKIPQRLRLIQVHTMFDVKVDCRFKTCVAANRHLTVTPVESVYFGVVFLKDFHTCVFRGELDDMVLWLTDIGNTYLKVKKIEKV